MSLAAWFNPELIGAAAHNALGAKAWTTMLAIASILVVVGLIRRKSRTLFCGSLLGTMSWLFASLSYLVAGNFDAVNALAFGLPGMIYFSYLHLKFSVFSVGTIGGHVLRGHSLK